MQTWTGGGDLWQVKAAVFACQQEGIVVVIRFIRAIDDQAFVEDQLKGRAVRVLAGHRDVAEAGDYRVFFAVEIDQPGVLIVVVIF